MLKLAYFLKHLRTSRANKSGTLRIRNAKFSGYCFYMNTHIQRDFQLFISVHLKKCPCYNILIVFSAQHVLEVQENPQIPIDLCYVSIIPDRYGSVPIFISDRPSVWQRLNTATDIAYEIQEQHFHEYSVRNIKVRIQRTKYKGSIANEILIKNVLKSKSNP